MAALLDSPFELADDPLMLTYQSRTQWLGLPFSPPASRIVSLVPSLTESLFRIGAGDLLVGRTQYCLEPAGLVDRAEVIGGTKNIFLENIKALKPDVVLANREENVKRQVEALAQDAAICLTDPLEPIDSVDLWLELGRITGKSGAASREVRRIEMALKAATSFSGAQQGPGPRFLYFVWKAPWMLAGHDTYISRMLATAGFVNALPEEYRRFPRVEPEVLSEIPSDVHFYCSEPYDFILPQDLFPIDEKPWRPLDGDWFSSGNDLSATRVDSQKLSWYPSQTAEGLRYVLTLRGHFSGFMERLSGK